MEAKQVEENKYSLEQIVLAVSNEDLKLKINLSNFFLKEYDQFSFNRFKLKFLEEIKDDKRFESFDTFKSYQIKCIEEMEGEDLKFLVNLTSRIIKKKMKISDDESYNITDIKCWYFNGKKELMIVNARVF